MDGLKALDEASVMKQVRPWLLGNAALVRSSYKPSPTGVTSPGFRPRLAPHLTITRYPCNMELEAAL